MEQWPLIGRTAELEVISDALAAADVSGVVLHGPGGMGKTRLAIECLRLGERAGFATGRAVATAYSREGAALAGLVPVGRSLGRRGSPTVV